MATLAQTHRRRASHADRSGLWAALVVVAILVAAIWGAWRLGVMAGQSVEWRQSLPDVPAALRKVPTPQPPSIPTQRRPAVEPATRD